jgi:hypothetical protein
MFTPNLSKPLRVFYVAFGVALGVSPFAINMDAWLRYVLPVLGLVSLAEGLAGW